MSSTVSPPLTAIAHWAICLLTSPRPTHCAPRILPVGLSTTTFVTSIFPSMKPGLSGLALMAVSISLKPDSRAALSDRPVEPAV
ncbi:MAG: hypothetical protein A4E61_00506 [Syntrophorhabdus sp. PtaB.Bin184]|nr:MAG: hypothetical protein A4E61_00506 [Syntrophorhabdus sp. PtaB.Bin184]